MVVGRTGLEAQASSPPGEGPDQQRRESGQAEALPGVLRGPIEAHRAIAFRHLAEGNRAAAFTELVRATRAVPMTARLASALANVAYLNGSHSAAVTLLNQGLDEVEDDELVGVLRAVSRLLRRTGDLERSREHLVLILAQRPSDRRARAVLNALLEREERWDELDASLEKETREELRRGALQRASRATARRARLWGERRKDPARAALRYGQAAQYSEQANDVPGAFLLRLLWVQHLSQSQAPQRTLDEAVKKALALAAQLGLTERAGVFLRGLGLPPPGAAEGRDEPPRAQTHDEILTVTEALLESVEGEPPVELRWRNSTQLELVAVAEAARAGSPRSPGGPAAGPRNGVVFEVASEPVAWPTAATELGDPVLTLSPSFGGSPAQALGEERQALFERVRGAPLDPDGYKLLAEHFDSASDSTRSSLMLEIARALEGDPHAAPRAPRLILSAADRLGLKHPTLRGEEGELLSLVGLALCRLYPARGAAETTDEFHLTSGKGARAAADALLASVRVLGLRAPDVFVTPEPGPPLTLACTTEPRLLVTRAAVRKEYGGAELRFFAGRALFSLSPDLLVLRNVRREQLALGLQVVGEVVASRQPSAEARVVRSALSQRAFDRVRHLFPRVGRGLDLVALAEAARHSTNRAGLVVCGGIAPAVDALRAKQALPPELIELVRYAASERYLQLRSRRIGVAEP